MNEATTSSEVAAKYSEMQTFDPALGAYNFSSLGDAVKFAELMSRAGEMLPPHLRMKPALCLAVVMRSQQWKVDPFALALETYQASQGGVIAYQAKVFVMALEQCAGINLKYRFVGELKRTGKPVLSARGNQIAKNGFTGNLKCIAYGTIDGDVVEYETPEYDDIEIKNSPLWHSDPKQQFAYYAGRGWTRRYKPAVIMGAYSPEEVDRMNEVRDITPKVSGFAALTQQARDDAKTEPSEEGEPAEQDGATEDAQTNTDNGDVEVEHVNTDDEKLSAYNDGVEEAMSDLPVRSSNPYRENAELGQMWFSGFDSVDDEPADESKGAEE